MIVTIKMNININNINNNHDYYDCDDNNTDDRNK